MEELKKLYATSHLHITILAPLKNHLHNHTLNKMLSTHSYITFKSNQQIIPNHQHTLIYKQFIK